MTIGEFKELSQLFNGKKDSNLTDHLIGKYVIVRSYNEGVNAGYVKAADSTGIVLTECRRIWRVISKDKSQAWYEGVANSGLDDNSKCSSIVDEKAIIERYSVTICKEPAIKSIIKFKTATTTC